MSTIGTIGLKFFFIKFLFFYFKKLKKFQNNFQIRFLK